MIHKCLRCFYEWASFLKLPKACPSCKSYSWQKSKTRALKSPQDTPQSHPMHPNKPQEAT